MAEKDYKDLYEKSLVVRRKQKEQISRLQDRLENLKEERLSCDVEPLKGELFGDAGRVVRVEGQLYVKLQVWTTESNYAGHIIGSGMPSRKYEIFLRSANFKRPIPHWFWSGMGLDCVIARGNQARFIMNPVGQQPKHLLIIGHIGSWESWNEDFVSDLQLEHDRYYLEKLAESASMYVRVNDDDESDENESDGEAGDIFDEDDIDDTFYEPDESD